jgi:hypothetical protein
MPYRHASQCRGGILSIHALEVTNRTAHRCGAFVRFAIGIAAAAGLFWRLNHAFLASRALIARYQVDSGVYYTHARFESGVDYMHARFESRCVIDASGVLNRLVAAAGVDPLAGRIRSASG